MRQVLLLPQLTVKVSATKGWSTCKKHRHPSEERGQGFKYEEAKMSGNGTVEY